MRDGRGLFFREGLNNFSSIGTVFPASSKVASALAGTIPDMNGTIVELGGGLGAITDEIVRRKKEGQKIITFESNREFALGLKERYGDEVSVVNQDAQALSDYVDSNVISVVSSLPLALMDELSKRNILSRSKERMVFGATFSQYQTRPFPKDKRLVGEYFSDIHTKWMPSLNPFHQIYWGYKV